MIDNGYLSNMYIKVIIFISIVIIFIHFSIKTNNINDVIYKLRRKLSNDRRFDHTPSSYFGVSNIVRNITVYGAVITSNIDLININPTTLSPSEYESMKIGFLRLNNIQNLTNDLPFQLVHWPAIYTRPCPQNRHGHKTERGLAVAHYHIWLDFIFFDHDVLDELAKGSIHGEYTSTTWTSTSGIFTAYDNGTLYKNGKPFSEDDILVIFEDDAISAIKDCNTTMIEELSDMSTDFLYLGWCEGRLARPVPLCSHSYAVTRRGARKLAKYFEPCGMAIDEQFVKFAKNNWISYRTAHPFSYNNNYKEGFPEPGVKNYGIFHQNKYILGSLLGH